MRDISSLCDQESEYDAIQEAIAREISTIHVRWLINPRDDLRGQSPREVLLARQDFIDHELHMRELQWSLQSEGPPASPLIPLLIASQASVLTSGSSIRSSSLPLLVCSDPATLLRRGVAGSTKAVELAATISRLEELEN